MSVVCASQSSTPWLSRSPTVTSSTDGPSLGPVIDDPTQLDRQPSTSAALQPPQLLPVPGIHPGSFKGIRMEHYDSDSNPPVPEVSPTDTREPNTTPGPSQTWPVPPADAAYRRASVPFAQTHSYRLEQIGCALTSSEPGHEARSREGASVSVHRAGWSVGQTRLPPSVRQSAAIARMAAIPFLRDVDVFL